MELTILGPDQKKNIEIAWVELNTLSGNYVILPGHAPMILVLTPQAPLTYAHENGTQTNMVIAQGLAHIKRTSVTILLS